MKNNNFSSLVVALLALSSTQALCDFPASKITGFLAKKGTCVLAVGTKSMAKNDELNSIVDCVGDLVANEGTMNEKNVCGYFTYDAEHDKSQGTGLSGELIFSPHECGKGGFESLVKMVADPSGMSVGTVMSRDFKVFIYASDSKYKGWFQNAVKATAVAQTQKSKNAEKNAAQKKKEMMALKGLTYFDAYVTCDAQNKNVNDQISCIENKVHGACEAEGHITFQEKNSCFADKRHKDMPVINRARRECHGQDRESCFRKIYAEMKKSEK